MSDYAALGLFLVLTASAAATSSYTSGHKF